MTDPPRADLHAHTTASDGALGPEALVRLAASRGVAVLAVTDHDSVESVERAVAEGARSGVRVVPGVELSVRVPHGSMHLLGYFAQARPPALVERLEALRAGRLRRAERMVAALCDLGAPIDLDAVVARAAGAVGRPHLADELVAAGHVASRQEAFERYLGDGAAAWVPAEGLGPDEAVALVRAAGGAPALAHPASLRLDRAALAATVQRLAARGLAGIEVHRPEHLPERRDEYAALARRLRLVATGGSDFHDPRGPNAPGDTGRPPLPLDAIDRLMDAAGA